MLILRQVLHVLTLFESYTSLAFEPIEDVGICRGVRAHFAKDGSLEIVVLVATKLIRPTRNTRARTLG